MSPVDNTHYRCARATQAPKSHLFTEGELVDEQGVSLQVNDGSSGMMDVSKFDSGKEPESEASLPESEAVEVYEDSDDDIDDDEDDSDDSSEQEELKPGFESGASYPEIFHKKYLHTRIQKHTVSIRKNRRTKWVLQRNETCQNFDCYYHHFARYNPEWEKTSKIEPGVSKEEAKKQKKAWREAERQARAARVSISPHTHARARADGPGSTHARTNVAMAVTVVGV